MKLRKKLLSIILTVAMVFSFLPPTTVIAENGSDFFIQSIGKPNLTMGTDWQNPLAPPFYPAHWNVNPDGAATYLVIETNARPENLWGFGGTRLVLQGDADNWQSFTDELITGHWTGDTDITKKTFFIIDLTKLANYSNFAASDTINIIFTNMAEQIFYGANIENAWLTNIAFDTSKFTPASTDAGSDPPAVAGAVFFSQNFDWVDYTNPIVPPSEIGGFTTGWGMMEKLGMGINIGNTLDARPWGCNPANNDTNACNNKPCSTPCPPSVWNWLLQDHMESEITWSNPRIEKWHFEAFAEKGLDHVRIPITWELHMDENRNINQDWMDRVQEVVDWALEAGLIVIINTHHERSTPQSLYDMSSHSFEDARDWLIDVWEQIADVFKDYDTETLLFEPMNEPYPRATHGWFWDYNVFAAEIPAYAERINQLNAVALETIRNSGGNNDKRVVIGTVPQANAHMLNFYEKPADPFTMVGIFFYEGDSLGNIPPALYKGIPIYVKEIAPLIDLSGTSGETMGIGDMVSWTELYFGYFANLGIPTAWWNISATDEGWQLVDMRTNVWNTPLVNAFFAAYNRTPGTDFVPHRYRMDWNHTQGLEIGQNAHNGVSLTKGVFIDSNTNNGHHYNPFGIDFTKIDKIRFTVDIPNAQAIADAEIQFIINSNITGWQQAEVTIAELIANDNVFVMTPNAPFTFDESYIELLATTYWGVEGWFSVELLDISGNVIPLSLKVPLPLPMTDNEAPDFRGWNAFSDDYLIDEYFKKAKYLVLELENSFTVPTENVGMSFIWQSEDDGWLWNDNQSDLGDVYNSGAYCAVTHTLRFELPEVLERYNVFQNMSGVKIIMGYWDGGSNIAGFESNIKSAYFEMHPEGGSGKTPELPKVNSIIITPQDLEDFATDPVTSRFLQQSGNPALSYSTNGLRVSSRANTWDAVDLRIGELANGRYTMIVEFEYIYGMENEPFLLSNPDSPHTLLRSSWNTTMYFDFDIISENGETLADVWDVHGNQSRQNRLRISADGLQEYTIKSIQVIPFKTNFVDVQNWEFQNLAAWGGTIHLSQSGDAIYTAVNDGNGGIQITDSDDHWAGVNFKAEALWPGNYVMEVEFAAAQDEVFVLGLANEPWWWLAASENPTKSETLECRFTIIDDNGTSRILASQWNDDTKQMDTSVQDMFNIHTGGGVIGLSGYTIVSIKVYLDKTNHIEVSQDDFEAVANGAWDSGNIARTGGATYVYDDGIKVTGRTGNWQGVDLIMDYLTPGYYSIEIEFEAEDGVVFELANSTQPYGALQSTTDNTLHYAFHVDEVNGFSYASVSLLPPADHWSYQERLRIQTAYLGDGVNVYPDFTIKSIKVYPFKTAHINSEWVPHEFIDLANGSEDTFFFRKSGNPTYTAVNGGNGGITVSERKGNYYGVDLKVDSLWPGEYILEVEFASAVDTKFLISEIEEPWRGLAMSQNPTRSETLTYNLVIVNDNGVSKALIHGTHQDSIRFQTEWIDGLVNYNDFTIVSIKVYPDESDDEPIIHSFANGNHVWNEGQVNEQVVHDVSPWRYCTDPSLVYGIEVEFAVTGGTNFIGGFFDKSGMLYEFSLDDTGGKPVYGDGTKVTFTFAAPMEEDNWYTLVPYWIPIDGTVSIVSVTLLDNSGQTVAKTHHDFSDWGSDTATCTAPGTQSRVCSKCSDVDTQTTSALGHNYVSNSNGTHSCSRGDVTGEACSPNGYSDVCGKCGYMTPADPSVPQFTITNTKATTGKEFTVEIGIINNPGIVGLNAILAFDTDNLELISVNHDLGGFGIPGFPLAPLASGMNIVWNDFTIDENITFNGTIARLTFIAKNEGNAWITVTCHESLDEDFIPVSFASATKTISISSVLVGHVAGNANIGLADSMLLSRYIAGWYEFDDMNNVWRQKSNGNIVNLNLPNAYIAGNTTIGLADSMLLSRYIAGWYEYDYIAGTWRQKSNGNAVNLQIAPPPQ
ncbi:MAG: cellulase family glycosylhydrolase [Oscillospiraceae bacterium]|nr:cellulase family glycosylhydrolase [Oscillospiraceae bacterium]